MRRLVIVSLALAVLSTSACGRSTVSPPDVVEPVQSPVSTPTAPPVTAAGHITPLADGNIVQVWANDGGDKVTRDELRAVHSPGSVINSVWDGTKLSLFGARNEVVSFALILEVPTENALDVEVDITPLDGPDGASISTRPADGDDIFNDVGRNIELFYVRYLEIKGVSTDLFFAGYDYDERHIPERCRRPFNSDGEGEGIWEDRPCHNLFYPEIAVPLELHTPFTVPAGSNQSIWGDITIPHDTPAGVYTGTILVKENGVLGWEIPVNLNVRDFTLPDLPNARTMVYYSQSNINDRYLGQENVEPERGSPAYDQALTLADRHFQLAHRHKVSLIDGYIPLEEMDDAWVERLSGELFTPEQGYEGVGSGVGNNVYSIGTYGGWPWQDGGREEMWANCDAWVNWFEAQTFATPTEFFLYLIDESDDYELIEQWAKWIEDNPGPGQRMMSLATIDLPVASEHVPSLDIPTSWPGPTIAAEWEGPLEKYLTDSSKRFYMYNSNRPFTGSFAIEDEGVALRELAWVQYKIGVDRWFYWESTYYDNFQGDMGQTDVFRQAHTFGSFDEVDEVLGETGWNYLNGDGVLFYPGTDTRYPANSYGVQGPFASLRLKHWRRGIQDVDYLTLAMAVDPVRTTQILNSMVPRAVWEVGVSDPEDPTWVLTDISWSINPDTWESARQQLADIIEGG